MARFTVLQSIHPTSKKSRLLTGETRLGIFQGLDVASPATLIPYELHQSECLEKSGRRRADRGARPKRRPGKGSRLAQLRQAKAEHRWRVRALFSCWP